MSETAGAGQLSLGQPESLAVEAALAPPGVVSAVSAQGSLDTTEACLEEPDIAAQSESLRPEEPDSTAQSESLRSEEPDIAERSESIRSEEAPVIPPRKTARRTLDPAGTRSSWGWQTQLEGRGMLAGRRWPG